MKLLEWLGFKESVYHAVISVPVTTEVALWLKLMAKAHGEDRINNKISGQIISTMFMATLDHEKEVEGWFEGYKRYGEAEGLDMIEVLKSRVAARIRKGFEVFRRRVRR